MPQPEKKLDPARSPQHWFGSELRLWRKRQPDNMSARQLGLLVQVSGDVILAVEKGQYPSCRYDLAVRLDEVLETGGVLARAWPMVFGDAEKKRRDADKQPGSRVERPTQVSEGRILGSDATPPHTEGAEPVDRRSLLQAGGAAALIPTNLVDLLTPSAQSEQPGKIRPSHIAQVQGVASSIHRWDNVYGGGGMVRDVAGRAMTWAAGLLYADCPDGLRRQLLTAVSRLGVVVGASAFDSYAHDDAQRTFRFAAECAEEAGNWHLRAKAYSFLSRQAIWVGEADDGLTHAEKGLVRSDRITATERAMLHTARARAFAKMGNVRETLTAVGQADDAFSDSDPSVDPSWMAYYDAAQHSGDTAHALFDLAVKGGQDPARAGQRFLNAIHGHGDAFKRSRAISRTKLASLMMSKGDPRQAAQIGHDALDEVGQLTSRRAADDLRQLGRFSGKHPAVSDATDLRERIALTLRG
ncbi:XRE family transcriptional regulator [Streptomyces sp. DSM 42041]|uniref:XRE family transcriptional regulator n=1 Tax=Streptomyces hazeniae TaxID=3075538 RepID=A0ABU2NNP8_9ACTN|nr:XRE family transcriptional regulator [Streptomyces sp. DSM 42041]MDT0378400.1 XRE family transcriptional regulator [Streptomyces sp. DSM 42041]